MPHIILYQNDTIQMIMLIFLKIEFIIMNFFILMLKYDNQEIIIKK